MRLDSARELKHSIIEQILSGRLLPDLMLHAAAALSAVRPAGGAGPRATVALGIARRACGGGKTRGTSGRGGPAGFRLAVRIQQRPMDRARIVEAIEKKTRGEVDVRYVGSIRPMAASARGEWARRRQRPLVIGCSIGHAESTAGTLGCFARDSKNRLGIISNNHVLAAENAAKLGDLILQPGPVDGGRGERSAAARLSRVVRLRPRSTNRMDAAFAVIEPGIECDLAGLRHLGQLRGIGPELDLGDEVAKLGRATGLTRGRVSAIELDNVVVDFGIGRLRFDDQVEIEGTGRAARARGGGGSRPFSLAGDSGALVFGADLAAAALLFAGSDRGGQADHGLTYATPIAAVLRGLKVKLAEA